MTAETPFHDLIRRVRDGDELAAAELVRRYEPAIRRTVRFRLGDGRLGRLVDSEDICQSVLKSFFIRVAAGQYDLDSPEQLLKLFVSMARNKLAGAARRQQRECRDQRREQFGELAETEFVAPSPAPGDALAARELLHETFRRLNADERHLVELRHQGLEWSVIAERLGDSPEALRKKLARALDRVAEDLGLDEPS